MKYVITIIIGLLIILSEIFILKDKCKVNTPLFNNLKKLIKIVLLIICIYLIGMFVINLFMIDIKDNIFKIVMVGLLVFPLELINLRKSKVFLKEDLAYTKYVILNKVISEKKIRKYNKAYIKVIMLSDEDVSYRIKTIKKSDLNKNCFKNNILIRDCKVCDIVKYLDDYVIGDCYDDIYESRGLYDNFLRSISVYINMYLSLMLVYLMVTILGYPLLFNINMVLLVKLVSIWVVKVGYEKMRFDTDLMTRKIRDKGKMFYGQELLFNVMQSMLAFIGLVLIYVYVITVSMNNEFGYSILYLMYLFMIVFITFVNVGENLFIVNVIKSFKDLRMLLFLGFMIMITILILFVKEFGMINIGIRNYFGCMFCSLVFTIVFDVVKLARYTSIKRCKND